MTFDFDQLLTRAQDGDEAAAVEIWNEYYDRLVQYARSKMQVMPRRAADEEDVALSAMNSFFAGIQEGRLAPKDPDELWKLLATIAVRKAVAQLRKHYAAKRGGGQIRGNSAFDEDRVAESAGAGTDLDVLSPHLGEACEEMLMQLEDPTLQQIALLRLASHTNQEIADSLGCSLAKVKRSVAEIRDLWSELQ